ncbi:hypothetical protein HBH98_255440 [Parastagonospora nodorum]|nr:hypothetical protein HBH53_264070 [Parastagonospora nodorum]KAH3956008.1 hypothetical protein HBH51_258390 [Parastagonospora nodorum]KAH4215283.1 hypothetical protein HBI06_257710 [Parastagonospora nodorum]KAH4221696.1 hypothetical protein HBI05_255880 [Parastagonospora nodorum]KAH4331552.1 hypothetical protein HBH98_255440 [Parastagonospora nodorum]
MHTHYALIVALTIVNSASTFNCNGNYFSFFNRGGDTLSYARLDPSLHPGTTSPHLHSFDGGSGLSAATTFEDLVDSHCTTARIKQDKSLYWRPSLYWNGNGTGFYRVPEQYTKLYYRFSDGDQWANVTSFPENFSMLAGLPNKRADGKNLAGVRWGCHQPDGRDDKIFANGFPIGFQSCKYGFASEVTFPSCWNGRNIDPTKPQAHMAYPEQGSSGIQNCPPTHRAARFPSVLIEFWYDISSFDKQYDASSSPWTLSNGDTTGYGFHADFMNGWEKGILDTAVQQNGGCNCGCGCSQADIEQCFGSANVNKDGDPVFQQCGVVRGEPDEAARHVKILPGALHYI